MTKTTQREAIRAMREIIDLVTRTNVSGETMTTEFKIAGKEISAIVYPDGFYFLGEKGEEKHGSFDELLDKEFGIDEEETEKVKEIA